RDYALRPQRPPALDGRGRSEDWLRLARVSKGNETGGSGSFARRLGTSRATVGLRVTSLSSSGAHQDIPHPQSICLNAKASVAVERTSLETCRRGCAAIATRLLQTPARPVASPPLVSSLPREILGLHPECP